MTAVKRWLLKIQSYDEGQVACNSGFDEGTVAPRILAKWFHKDWERYCPVVKRDRKMRILAAIYSGTW